MTTAWRACGCYTSTGSMPGFPALDIGGQYRGHESKRPYKPCKIRLKQAENRTDHENHGRECRCNGRRPVALRRGRNKPQKGVERRDQGQVEAVQRGHIG